MKHLVSLAITLAITWLLWSGHTEPFLLDLGVFSIVATLYIVSRMQILDNEAAPTGFGLRPLFYLPYLIKEIVVSNIKVAKLILSPKMDLQRNMVKITAHQHSDIGRVVLANSITLTPGTVTILMEGDQLLIHALSFAGGEEDLSGEIDRRVCKMEGGHDAEGGHGDASPPDSTVPAR